MYRKNLNSHCRHRADVCLEPLLMILTLLKLKCPGSGKDEIPPAFSFQIVISSLALYFYLTCVYICFFPNPMKVPFEEVPELVAGRRVFIHKGYAYVAMNQVINCSCHQFFFTFISDRCLLAHFSFSRFIGGFPCCHTIPQSSVKGTHSDKQVVVCYLKFIKPSIIMFAISTLVFVK